MNAREDGEPGYERLVTMLFGAQGDRRRALCRITSTPVVTTRASTVGGFEEHLLRYRVDLPPAAMRFLDAPQALVRETVIRGPKVLATSNRNSAMIAAVFHAAMSGGIVLPSEEPSGKGVTGERMRG